jgi:arylsulfatase A-like enzyme
LLALFVLSAFSACRRDVAPEPPRNVLLIVIDTLRADRLGVYGNRRGLSPFLDELAARGVVFANAFSPSSWTVPAIASLFISHYPSQHKVTTFDSKIPDAAHTLAEELASHGYSSAGFSANFRLTEELGYAQGFENWQTYMGSKVTGVKVRGSRLRAESLGWLDGLSSSQAAKPQFLYLQYMEPHSPYQPSQPHRERFIRPVDGVDEVEANAKVGRLNFAAVSWREIRLLRSLYDGEVASVDAELRVLFEELERRGFLDRAIVIVTSDHGEEFKEHGRTAHGHALYDESIRVPLIILAPGYEAHMVEENVSLLDVAPTILDLLKLPAEPQFEGRSLVELMKRPSLGKWLLSDGEGARDVISELPPTGSRFDVRAHSRAIVRDSLKLLLALKGQAKEEVPELYDLAEDPAEKEPNPPGLVAEREALQTALYEEMQSLVRRAGLAGETAPVDEATKEKLRALGYTF